MERGKAELSAVQEVNRDYGLPVLSIANLDDLLSTAARAGQEGRQSTLLNYQEKIQQYRAQYGISGKS
jgi:orotate phosphoribosyltransferase